MLATAEVDERRLAPSSCRNRRLTAPNPGERGSYTVKTLFYGSGTDIKRPEFGKDVTIKTKTVDVSPFASIPKPRRPRTRKKFWGFDLKKAPINARVWYPDGTGPFPLVLIVHGNHNWQGVLGSRATRISASCWRRAASSWRRSTRTSSTDSARKTTGARGCC